jgi:hypothetical protein
MSRSFYTGFKINILPDVFGLTEEHHIRIGGVDEPSTSRAEKLSNAAAGWDYDRFDFTKRSSVVAF